MCASHYGEPMHKEVIQGILHKIGLPKEALKCGFQYSISAAYKEKQLQEHMVIDEMNSNCSGKHCAFWPPVSRRAIPLEITISLNTPFSRKCWGS